MRMHYQRQPLVRLFGVQPTTLYTYLYLYIYMYIQPGCPYSYRNITFCPLWVCVTEAPSGKPTLRLEKTHYGVGETIRGNCSSPISSPASNITWLVNNEKVSFAPVKYVKLETAILSSCATALVSVNHKRSSLHAKAPLTSSYLLFTRKLLRVARCAGCRLQAAGWRTLFC